MKIGDVVIPVGDFTLHCGSGFYSHAIVASVDPLVVISEQGDMLWRATIDESKLYPLCQAHHEIVARVLRRLENEKAGAA